VENSWLGQRNVQKSKHQSFEICVCQVHRNKDTSITLKLADFGLAMEVKESIFTVCGTPTYVAPEILTEIGELVHLSFSSSRCNS